MRGIIHTAHFLDEDRHSGNLLHQGNQRFDMMPQVPVRRRSPSDPQNRGGMSRRATDVLCDNPGAIADTLCRKLPGVVRNDQFELRVKA